MLTTHRTVCISRVDGIIKEWAEITTTPLTYRHPEWTHSRLENEEYGVHHATVGWMTQSQTLIQRFLNWVFRHCTHIRNVITWNFVRQIMWKWPLLTYNEVTKCGNCKIAIRCGVMHVLLSKKTHKTYHAEFTTDTIGISPDERTIHIWNQRHEYV